MVGLDFYLLSLLTRLEEGLGDISDGMLLRGTTETMAAWKLSKTLDSSPLGI